MTDLEDDMELVQALLQCQDEWHQVIVYRLFGRDEQAAALEAKLTRGDQ